MKIANKASLAIFTAIIIVVSIVSAAFYYIEKSTLEREIFIHLETIAKSRAAHVETYIEMVKGRLIDFSSDGKIKNCLRAIGNNAEDGCTSKELSEHLVLNKLPAIEDLSEVFTLDINGKVVGTTNPKEKSGADFSGESFFTKGKKQAYAQGIYYNEESNKIEMVVAAPVHIQTGGENLIGVVVGRINPKRLYSILVNRIGLGETGEVYLVNKNGLMVSPSHFIEDAILKQKVGTENSQECFTSHQKFARDDKVEQHEDRVLIFPDYKGVEVVGAHGYVSEPEWCLLAEMDATEAFSALKQVQFTIGGVLFVSLIVAVLFGFLGSRVITGPIYKLRQGTKIIGRGDLNYKIDIKSKDEIGDLARAFNEMTEGLKIKTTSVGLLNKEVAERRKAEGEAELARGKLEKYLESMVDGVLVTDLKGRVLYANKAYEKLFGYSRDELLGKQVMKVGMFKLKNVPRAQAVLKEILKKGRVRDVEFDTVTRGKKEIIVKFSANLTKSLQGKPESVIISVRDVSELKQTKRTVEKLKELDKLKDDFLNIAAHELKTPLTSIVGLSEIVKNQKTSLSPEQKNYLDIIHEEGVKLSHIMKRILTVTRFESGKETVFLEKINLSTLIVSLLPTLNVLAQKTKSKVISKTKDSGLVLNTDKEKVAEVICNFVDNALKYGPEAQTVTVSANKENTHITIKVTDQGKGITDAQQKKLFSKFSQLEPSLSRSQEGTGLGLYICKLIVDKLDGEIGVESSPGKGATFYFTLPLHNSKKK